MGFLVSDCSVGKFESQVGKKEAQVGKFNGQVGIENRTKVVTHRKGFWLQPKAVIKNLISYKL